MGDRHRRDGAALADALAPHRRRTAEAARHRHAGHLRETAGAPLGCPTPEAGAAFGGQSKRSLPGRDPRDLEGYLVEVRRAEWVHWVSMLCVAPVAVLGPWWLALAFAAVIVLVNLAFIVILRHNRIRLLALLRRSERVV